MLECEKNYYEKVCVSLVYKVDHLGCTKILFFYINARKLLEDVMSSLFTLFHLFAFVLHEFGIFQLLQP